MLVLLQILAVLLVAIAMTLSLAHALELPGKLRLTREAYLAVQPIYYPGFTIGGVAEPAGLVVLLILLLLTTVGTVEYLLTVSSIVALAAMHATYWLLTHPVNNFWLDGFELKGAAASFFSYGAQSPSDANKADWTELRDRWELSHVIRAIFGLTSLAALAGAVAL